MLSKRQKKLARKLFEVGAFKDKSQSEGGKGFRLKLHETNPNAPLSPFYLNLRTPSNPNPGNLTPEIVEEIGQQFYGYVCCRGLDFDCVVGVPRAGNPLARAFSTASTGGNTFPLLLLEKMETGEIRSIGRIIDGDFEQGQTALLVDDLITRAGSKIEAIEMLRLEGLLVQNVMVLLDREQGAFDQLRKVGCVLHALMTMSELLKFYREEGLLTSTVFTEIRSYLDAQ